MSEPFSTVISAVIGGLFALAAQWAASWLARRKAGAETKKIDAEATKTEAEASETITRTAMSLVGALEKKVDALEKTVGDLTTRMQVMEDALCEAESALYDIECERDEVIVGANHLSDQVISLGGEPVYKPPPARPIVKPPAQQPAGRKGKPDGQP